MKLLFAAALLICPVAVSAQTSEDANKPSDKPVKEKKTCRSLTATGSFMATRVCNTAAAWRQFDGITADGAQQTRDAYRMTSAGTLNTKR
ncbi:hypothetical protein [Sphingomonas ginsenosidivorax]|uniref:hypothetical protein n=1 Tax=Sphingomonas ginsenosidivorax TaxID=862135 RepID=UPI001F54C5C9|nr:hypothetical protein [Sphingomonas ginsenosidivorax]